MQTIYDTDAAASSSLYGGDSATRAVGLPVSTGLGRAYAPGGSTETASALLQQMRDKTAAMMAEVPQEPAVTTPFVGYKEDTNEYFSAGKVFKADLNEGRQAEAAGLFDVVNEKLPPGFKPVLGAQAKAKLKSDFENQGFMSDVTRRAATKAAGFAGTGRELGIPGAESARQYFSDVAARNPSQISTAKDLLDKPLTTVQETMGELPVDLAAMAVGAGVGAKAGAAAGAVFGPAGAGVGAGLGAILGGTLANFPEFFGNAMTEQRSKGVYDPARAVMTSAGSSALELLGPEAWVARSVAKKIAAKGLPAAVGDLSGARALMTAGAAKTVGKKLAVGAAIEGPLTEFPQTVLDRYGGYSDLLSTQAIDEYIISTAKGAIGGGVSSTIQGTAEYQSAKNFTRKLAEDQAIAQDVNQPVPERIAAAKRVKAILDGNSSDPAIAAELAAFRAAMTALAAAGNAAATAAAVQTGAPANLMQAQGPALTPAPAPVSAPLTPLQVSSLMGPAPTTPVAPAPVSAPLTPMQQSALAGPGGAATPAPAPAPAPAAPVTPTPAAPAAQAPDEFADWVDSLFPQQPAEAPAPVTPAAQAPTQDEAFDETDEVQEDDPTTEEAAAAFDAKVERIVAQATNRTMKPDEADSLQAAIRSPNKIPVTGKPSMPIAVYAAIRNYLLSPKSGLQVRKHKSALKDPELTAQYREKIKAITAVVAQLGDTYASLLSKGRNNVPSDSDPTRLNKVTSYRKSNITVVDRVPKPKATATEEEKAAYAAYVAYERAVAEENIDLRQRIHAEKLDAMWGAAEGALARLGELVDYNAKDIEIIVRLVKARAQAAVVAARAAKKSAKNYQALQDKEKRWKQVDIGFSRAWRDAKANTFRGGVDAMTTRGGAVRQSFEVEGTGKGMPPLRGAAENGYSPSSTEGDKVTGALGILAYLRSHGTPWEALMAKALSDTLKVIGAPTVVFTKDPDVVSNYNPETDTETDTVTVHETTSPEIVLHELWHAATQQFVLKNPKAEVVTNLLRTLDAVAKFDVSGMSKQVKDVHAIIKKLYDNKATRMDALLELIAYGNTMNDFRKALTRMPVASTPKTFMKAATDLWNSILALAHHMFGKDAPPSAGKDVILGSIQLLEAASKTKPDGEREGNVLYASVASNATNPNTQPIRAGVTSPVVDLRKYNEQTLPLWLSTQFVFNLVGWEKVPALVAEHGPKLKADFQKKFPQAAGVASYVAANFNVPQPVVELFKGYKINKQAGYKQAEMLAAFIESRTAAEQTALFNYLDGDKTALDSLPDAIKFKAIADDVLTYFEMYKAAAPQELQAVLNADKFSETLLFAESTKQVASNTFGVRNLSSLFGTQTYDEVNLDAILNTNNTPPNVGEKFYELVKKTNGKMVHEGFVSIADHKANIRHPDPNVSVQEKRTWTLRSYKPDNYHFVSNMTAKEAIAAKQTEKLSNALRNTMAALGGAYAAKQFSDAMSKETFVYRNLDDIPVDIRPDATHVLNIAGGLSESPDVQAKFRATDTWVKLPFENKYGDMQGKYMPGPVWMAMQDMSDRTPLINMREYNTLLRWFKKAKTVFSPATHGTNILTNVSLASLHDIPFHTIGTAASLFNKFYLRPATLTKSEMALMQSFMNSNAMLGDFSSMEVKEAIYSSFTQALRGKSDVGVITKLALMAKVEKAKAEKLAAIPRKMNDFATGVYAAEDNVFRLAAFLKRAGELQSQGKKTEAERFAEAGEFASTAFLNYDIDSKAVKMLRQSFLPFVSWSYAIMPVMGHIALHQPWKIVNLMSAYMLTAAIMDAMTGEDDEELKRKRRIGPEAVRENMFGASWLPYMHVRMPFAGNDKDPVYMPMGKYFPLSNIHKGTPQGVFGMEWVPQAITPSGPFMSVLIAMLTNRDQYTGKELTATGADTLDKLWSMSKVVYGQFTPSWASPNSINTMLDLGKGKTDAAGAAVSPMVIAKALGFGLVTYNEQAAEITQRRAVQAINRAYSEEIGRAKRNHLRYPGADIDELNKRLADLLESRAEEIADVKGGDKEMTER